MENFNKENKYIRAKERVAELKKFYSNLTAYVVIISFLAGVNYWTDKWAHPWFLWAAFGWGLGLLFHALKTFNYSPFFGKNWEERKIKEFMEEERDQVKNQRWE